MSPTRIGIVSDTHGQVFPALHELFSGVERILHAGDVGPESVTDELEVDAPVEAVRGNCDPLLPLDRYPVFRRTEIAGVRFLLTHIVDDPIHLDTEIQRHVDADHPAVVLYGHTHRPRILEHNGILFLNPGSAGPRRFRLPRTAGILEIENGNPSVVLYDLERMIPYEPEQRS